MQMKEDSKLRLKAFQSRATWRLKEFESKPVWWEGVKRNNLPSELRLRLWDVHTQMLKMISNLQMQFGGNLQMQTLANCEPLQLFAIWGNAIKFSKSLNETMKAMNMDRLTAQIYRVNVDGGVARVDLGVHMWIRFGFKKVGLKVSKINGLVRTH